MINVMDTNDPPLFSNLPSSVRLEEVGEHAVNIPVANLTRTRTGASKKSKGHCSLDENQNLPNFKP